MGASAPPSPLSYWMFQLLFLVITCEFYEHLFRNERSALSFISSASLVSIFIHSYTFSPQSFFFSQHLHYHPLLTLWPSVFSCGALMHVEARFHSVCHPIIINLSPTHKPVVHMGLLRREVLSVKGRGICYGFLLPPWLQGHKRCLAAPGTEHHHYSLLVHLLL